MKHLFAIVAFSFVMPTGCTASDSAQADVAVDANACETFNQRLAACHAKGVLDERVKELPPERASDPQYCARTHQKLDIYFKAAGC